MSAMRREIDTIDMTSEQLDADLNGESLNAGVKKAKKSAADATTPSVPEQKPATSAHSPMETNGGDEQQSGSSNAPVDAASVQLRIFTGRMTELWPDLIAAYDERVKLAEDSGASLDLADFGRTLHATTQYTTVRSLAQVQYAGLAPVTAQQTAIVSR